MATSSGSVSKTKIEQYKFVGEPSETYICPICLIVCSEPLQAVCCGKLICRKCYEEHIEKSFDKNCPCCKQKLEIVPDKRAEQEIGNLKVYCSNQVRGCEEVVELNYLTEHRSVCPYEVVLCRYSAAGCTEKLQRMEMDKHDEAFKDKHLLLCLTMLLDQDEVIKEQDEKIRKLEHQLRACNITIKDKNDEIKKLQNDIIKMESQLEDSSKIVAELNKHFQVNQSPSDDLLVIQPTFKPVTRLFSVEHFQTLLSARAPWDSPKFELEGWKLRCSLSNNLNDPFKGPRPGHRVTLKMVPKDTDSLYFPRALIQCEVLDMKKKTYLSFGYQNDYELLRIPQEKINKLDSFKLIIRVLYFSDNTC